jgi:acyl carrier protein
LEGKKATWPSVAFDDETRYSPAREPECSFRVLHMAGREHWNRWKYLMPDSTSEALPELELAQLIVRTLNLEIAASEIAPEAPLYAEGLGLDSIDILEIALAVSQSYGVKLRSDDAKNKEIFRSLRSLSQYIQAHRVA